MILETSYGSFRTLVNLRQDYVYTYNLSPSDPQVKSMDRDLNALVNFRKIPGRWTKQAVQMLLRCTEQEERWFRFYKQPQIVRDTLEKLCQLLGYKGGWIND